MVLFREQGFCDNFEWFPILRLNEAPLVAFYRPASYNHGTLLIIYDHVLKITFFLNIFLKVLEP